MGTCNKDGTLRDGEYCDLACNEGFTLIIEEQPHCVDGTIFHEVECLKHQKYERSLWGAVSVGAFFCALGMLILYVGCGRIKLANKRQTVGVQPLTYGLYTQAP
jgi:hypothetical protein